MQAAIPRFQDEKNATDRVVARINAAAMLVQSFRASMSGGFTEIELAAYKAACQRLTVEFDTEEAGGAN
jgi:hypothetical protein